MHASPFVDLMSRALASLLEPLAYPMDAGQRLYWPYLLGAMVIAWVAPSGRTLFDLRIWWHPSSRVDMMLMFAKAPIRVLLLALIPLSAWTVAVGTTSQLHHTFMAPTPPAWSSDTIMMVYSLTLFVSWDFSRFALHWLAHRLRPLWHLHQVHHSAQVMTPLTLYRTHPFESVLFRVRGIVVTGVVAGLFVWLFRARVEQLELFGVSAAGAVLNLLGGNLRHSHVRLGYPRWLEHILLSPAQHQIHHARDPALWHTNLGGWLAIWDWAAGSLRLSADHPVTTFGLTDEACNHRPDRLVSALVAPVGAMFALSSPPAPPPADGSDPAPSAPRAAQTETSSSA